MKNKTHSRVIFYCIVNFNESLSTQNNNQTDNQSDLLQANDLESIVNALEDNITLHFNVENHIIGIPVKNCPINIVKNQIIISEVNPSLANPKVINLFNEIQRIIVKFF